MKTLTEELKEGGDQNNSGSSKPFLSAYWTKSSQLPDKNWFLVQTGYN